MKLISLGLLLLLLTQNCPAQENLQENGFNLERYCPVESCTYFSFERVLTFPFDNEGEWQLHNFEVAINKNSGKLLINSDIHVPYDDFGLFFELEINFVSADDKDLLILHTEKTEFFNEPGQAEPFVYSTKVDKSIAESIMYVNVYAKSSHRLPYYELSSSCYLPCKEAELKAAIQNFKKAK